MSCACHPHLQGNTHEAAAYFVLASGADPTQARYLHHHASMLSDLKSYDDAARMLRRALSRGATAEERSAIELDLAHVLADSGRPADAVAVLQQAVAGPAGDTAAAHYTLGQAIMASLAAGSTAVPVQAALAAYTAALALAPHSIDVLRGLALAHATAGDPAEAAALLDRAVALAPHDGRLLGLAGQAHAQAGHVDEAIVRIVMCVCSRAEAVPPGPRVGWRAARDRGRAAAAL